MIDVLRQLGSAVFSVEQHLHERKRIRPVKHASRRIKNAWTLPKKFLQRQRLLGITDCLSERATMTSGRKRECAVNQPIGRLNQHGARIDVRLFSINHFEQNRAEQYPFDK